MTATAQLWWHRAEQARRLAPSLSRGDAELLHAYARECEHRVHCLSNAAGEHLCIICPLAGRERCQA
jgi:hypothetical protein